MYKSINTKKYKYVKIALLAKSKLNRVEVFISKTLIDSNISHDEYVLMNNVLKEFMIWKKKSKIQIISKSSDYVQNNVVLLFQV